MSAGRRPNLWVYAITDGEDYYDIFTSEDEAAHYFDDVAKYEGIPAERLRVEVLIANPEPERDSGEVEFDAKLAELEALVERVLGRTGVP